VKVLVVHNRYRSDVPSGENRVVDAEIEMLTAAGVTVVPYLRSSDEIDSLSAAGRLTLPLQPVHGRRALADIERLITTHRPDILHLHNPYPFVSLSVVRAAHRLGVPVVQTVHNHRHSCMRGSYFRDGHDCRLCQGRATPWPAVQHGCYRDSRVQSVPMAAAFRLHRSDQSAVDLYVALTQPIADSLLASGLVRTDQVVVRPNTVVDPGPATPVGDGLLFVGRLTPEKGVDVLLEAWNRSGRPLGTLTIVGDGPLRRQVERAAAEPGSGVIDRGPLTAADVAGEMQRCAAVVVPSTSPEALPLVVLEAFSHGRPVLAAAAGGLASTVDDAVGVLVRATEDGLTTGLSLLAERNLDDMAAAARDRYEQLYSPTVVVAAQLDIYRSVIRA
jgi:glycosyltransferase involved in cell wall biosynthesis